MIFSENNLEHFLYASFKFGKVSRNPSMKISVKVILNKNRTFYVCHIPSVTFHYFTLFCDNFAKMVDIRPY